MYAGFYGWWWYLSSFVCFYCLFSFLGDSAACMFYLFGLKRRLDPRALSCDNTREFSSLFLPSATKRALCVRVILGSATRYSRPIWMVHKRSGKANAFMFSKCVLFSACSRLNVANPPMQLDIARWKSTTCFALLFFNIQQPQLQKIQPINSGCWGANQRKCSFLLVLHWLQKLSVNF